MSTLLDGLGQSFGSSPTLVRGTLLNIRGSVLTAILPSVTIGETVRVHRRNLPALPALVVGFDAASVQLLPLEHPEGIAPGAKIESVSELLGPAGPPDLQGVVLDALGNQVSAGPEHATHNSPEPSLAYRRPRQRNPPHPLERRPVCEFLQTGIRSIDGLLPIGRGQRMGLFAAAGVGKSTLLGSLARNVVCDVVVVALVGERGREIQEFLHEALGEQGRRKSVVVYATSDAPPAQRMLAASTATSIAEDFRAQGKHVLLLVDSLTRVARAIREVSLCLGELPVRQGYTPSVFTELPRLLERAGNDAHGSITALYTVLTSDEHEADPLSDELMSLLDGHIRLSRRIANQGIFPAIDPTLSLSRLAPKLVSRTHTQHSQAIVQGLAKLWREKDMLVFGGTPDPELQALIAAESQLNAFLTQGSKECHRVDETHSALISLCARLRPHAAQAPDN